MSNTNVPEYMLPQQWQRVHWGHLADALAQERSVQRSFDPKTAILPQPLTAIVEFIYDHLLLSSDLRRYDRVTPEQWETREAFETFQSTQRALFDATRLRKASFDEIQLFLTWMMHERDHRPEVVFASFTHGVLESLCWRLAEIAQREEEYGVMRES